MRDELDRSIRAAFELMIAEAPELGPSPNAVQVGLVREARRHRPNWDRVVAVAAVILLVIGTIGVLLTRRGGDGVVPVASIPTAELSTVAFTAPATAPMADPWPFPEGVEMVVYVAAEASPEEIDRVRSVLTAYPTIVSATGLRYLDAAESRKVAEQQLADDPVTLALLTPDVIPTLFTVDPIDPVNVAELAGLAEVLRQMPEVYNAALESEKGTTTPFGTPAPTTTQLPPLLTDGPPLFGDPETGASSELFLAAGEEFRAAGLEPTLVGPFDITGLGEIRIDVQLPTGSDSTDVGFVYPGDTDAYANFIPTVEPVGPDDGLVQVVLNVVSFTAPYLDYRIWLQ